MEQKDLSFPRGDTYLFDVLAKRIDPQSGQPVTIDLTGGKAWFTAKKTLSDQDVSATIALSTTTSGVAIVDPTSGRVRVTVPASSTTLLDADQKLFYDVQVMDSAGVVTTAQYGLLRIQPDVTRATA